MLSISYITCPHYINVLLVQWYIQIYIIHLELFIVASMWNEKLVIPMWCVGGGNFSPVWAVYRQKKKTKTKTKKQVTTSFVK